MSGQEHGKSGGQTGHVIIGGFGVVGRYLEEMLRQKGVPHCIIERNAAVASRLNEAGVKVLCGDVRQEEVLREAEVERAWMVALTFPDDGAALEAAAAARRLNPQVQVVMRCLYTSSGLQAERLGVDEVVVTEQIVARELAQRVEKRLGR